MQKRGGRPTRFWSRHRPDHDRRAMLIGLGASVLAVLATQGTSAATTTSLALVMVDDPACSYCRKFDAEVGPLYPTSPHGQAAPLVKLRQGSAELAALGLAATRYTPTFILLRGKDELGRITGYPGRSGFFEELGTMLDLAGAFPATPPAATKPGEATKGT